MDSIWPDDAGSGSRSSLPGCRPGKERDLERVLLDLAKGFPLLAALVGHRRGGQKALPLGPKADSGGEPGLGAALHAAAEDGLDAQGADPDAQPGTGLQDQPPREPQNETRTTPPNGPLAGDSVQLEPRRQRRPSRLGLAVQFEERPGDPELGRLVESTVLINTAPPPFGARRHPARRATTLPCPSPWRSRRSRSSRRRNTALSSHFCPVGAKRLPKRQRREKKS